MIEKLNKNAKVENFTNMLGIAVRLIVIDPFKCQIILYELSFQVWLLYHNQSFNKMCLCNTNFLRQQVYVRCVWQQYATENNMARLPSKFQIPKLLKG